MGGCAQSSRRSGLNTRAQCRPEPLSVENCSMVYPNRVICCLAVLSRCRTRRHTAGSAPPTPRYLAPFLDVARPNAPLEHYTLLQQSRFLETEETLANDDVIQEIDLKNLCSGHYTPGEMHIRLRRTRVA
jgi:hypothetical protein